MSVTQYIGARYVPIFAEPDQWTADRAYEPLTIVLHEGNSYTSKQAVPIGIEITNTQFWALTGNYNAQIEAYRREVEQFADEIEANAEAIEANSEEIAGVKSRFYDAAPITLQSVYKRAGSSYTLTKIKRDMVNLDLINADGTYSVGQKAYIEDFLSTHPHVSVCCNANCIDKWVMMNKTQHGDPQQSGYGILAVNTSTGDIGYFPTPTSASQIISNGYNSACVIMTSLLLDGAKTPIAANLSVRNRNPHPRQGIGWDSEYYYILTIEGRSIINRGMTYEDMQNLALELGIDNLVATDGGAGAQTAINAPNPSRVNTTIDFTTLEFERERKLECVLAFTLK